MAVKADITIDIDKQIGELQNLTQIYNARVGDNKTPLTIAWRKNDLPLNLKGLHAYIVGKTGDGSYNSETGKIDFPINTPVSQFEDDGSGTLDGGQSGLTTLLIPKQMWQKSGLFAGYVGLKSEDGSVFTSKDIWFKVLGNVLDAGVEINYFIGDFNKALAEAEKKLQDKEASFDQATANALQDLKNKYDQEVNEHSNALINDTALLRELATECGEILTQIKANEIVKKSDYDNDILNVRQEMQSELSKMSNSGPYFFKDIVELQSLFPSGHAGILITQNDMHWHYWNNEQKQYVDSGLYLNSSNYSASKVRMNNNVLANSNKIIGPFYREYFNDSLYSPNATLKIQQTSMYGLDWGFQSPGTIKSVRFKPYDKGKLYFGVATQLDNTHFFIKSEKIVNINTTDFQSADINLLYDPGDVVYVSGPILYSISDDGYNFYEVAYGSVEKALNSSIGYQTCLEPNAQKIKIDMELDVEEGKENTTLFPSIFHGKRIEKENDDFFDSKAITAIETNKRYLLNYHFADSGVITRVYYQAPSDGQINIGIGNIYDESVGAIRIHDDVVINVKKGNGIANINLPFFANDSIVVSGQIGFIFGNGFNFWEKYFEREFDSTKLIFGNISFKDKNAAKMLINLKFDTEIDDTSHFNATDCQNMISTATEPLNNPLKGKKYACFGDSIWSDQVTGIGTLVNNLLDTKLIGNFAVGWATATDWHKEDKNITPLTLIEPQNTDTADNVLSNQVRRLLQWTTAKDQIISWHHPLDGNFSIDKTVGLGLGHTEDIPDVLAISISTNDGKNEQCNVIDDVDNVLQQSYKDLTRNSTASGLRWAIETLRSAYPKVQIFVFTPLQTGANYDNQHGSYKETLLKSEIIKKVCQYCSVPVIDQFSNSGFSKIMTVTGTAGDGIHPIGIWKQKVARFDAQSIEQKYIQEN
ncbi:SGNH/GDSL hydrolase family protein [Lactobacillus gallinarum]|uniref:SGNH/GDSL hydrolase family protein n=1 Tax=Lactobacillus gallinarum TaxID=52242 RepID=UPI000B57AEA4|nr:SGNH/GDSL hydrolase family protein [Lactobacillus gallinarum]OUQ48181.1 hypothetical protein B5E63_06885 [Lactobacillus gallinarum]